MAKANIATAVRDLILDTVTGLGYSLWDVTFGKEGADWHLEVTIDREGGVTIDDCEKVHRAIDPMLDEADPIEVSYILDVSSPGVERELRTEEQILASLGSRCEAKLFAAVAGKKSVRGELLSLSDGKVGIRTEDGDIFLDRSAIARLRTVFFD